MHKIFTVVLLCAVALCSPEQIDIENTVSRVAISATYDQFPYVVSLQYARAATPALGHICGGGLVTLSHVLTAAHCMISFEDSSIGTYTLLNPNDYIVFTGAALLTNTGADRSRSVQQFIRHPDYIGTPSRVNDIGIVVLTQPFPSTIGIVPIALSNTRPADKTACTVAGWAATQFGQNVSNQLVYHNKYIYNQELCRSVYSSLMTNPNVLSSMICATSYNVRVQHCLGSGGNLLVCNRALTGVLSWHNCYETSDPELYTRTANYTAWIRQYTGDAARSSPGFAILALAIVINIIRLY